MTAVYVGLTVLSLFIVINSIAIIILFKGEDLKIKLMEEFGEALYCYKKEEEENFDELNKKTNYAFTRIENLEDHINNGK